MSKFKKGDIATCRDATNTDGSLIYFSNYEVADAGHGWVEIYVTNDTKQVFTSERFCKYSLPDQIDQPEERRKGTGILIGDKVMCIDNQCLGSEIKLASVYTVSGYSKNGFYFEETGKDNCFHYSGFCLASHSSPEAPKFNHSGSKYLRDIQTTLDGQIDVYAVLMAFNVTSPARQHAIKKLLCAGIRGKNNELNDVKEAKDAIERDIQMMGDV